MKISNIDEIFQNYISRAPDYNIEDYMFLLELEHEDIAKEDYEALKAKFNEYIANRNTEKASEAEITNSTDVKKKKRRYQYFLEIRNDNLEGDILPEDRFIERITKVPKSFFCHLYKLMESGYFIDRRDYKKADMRNWARNRLIIDSKKLTKTLIFDSYNDVQYAIHSRIRDLCNYLKNSSRLCGICKHEISALESISKSVRRSI